MKIGRYDQKIMFVTEGQEADGYGGTIPTDIEILETFASIEQVTQTRTIEQMQIGLPATYRVSVMYRQSFIPTKDMRIVWRDVKYNITTVPEVNNVRMQKEWTFVISAMQ